MKVPNWWRYKLRWPLMEITYCNSFVKQLITLKISISYGQSIIFVVVVACVFLLHLRLNMYIWFITVQYKLLLYNFPSNRGTLGLFYCIYLYPTPALNIFIHFKFLYIFTQKVLQLLCSIKFNFFCFNFILFLNFT